MLRLLIVSTFILLQVSCFSKVYLPNHINQNSKDTSLKNYYLSWKKKYIKEALPSKDKPQYIVDMFDFDNNKKQPYDTTSEAMGYGLIITALASRFDTNSKIYFDGLYKMLLRNKSTINSCLFSWTMIGHSEKTKRSDSAIDGDMDIAYGLVMANNLWGSKGVINYQKEAVDIINCIYDNEVNKENFKLMLGDWWHDGWNETTRTSDFMGTHLKLFANITGNRSFLKIRKKFYNIAQNIQYKYSKTTGLLPDFVIKSNSRPAYKNTLESIYDGHYYYNAARIPLRFILDYAHFNNKRPKEITNKIVNFVYKKSKGNIKNIKSGYYLNGKVIGDYFDSAFAAPIVAAATGQKRLQSFVNTGWDYLLKNKNNYYSDSLNMLSLFYLGGRWPKVANLKTI
jgi:endoglucanase